MKTFKIAKKTNEVVSTAPLPVESAGTSGNDIYVVVKKEIGQQLNVGGKLVFEKSLFLRKNIFPGFISQRVGAQK